MTRDDHKLRKARARTSLEALGVMLLLSLIVLAYLPAIQGGFVWDDDYNVTANPALRDAAGLGRIWAQITVPPYYPLYHSTLWAGYQLWGPNPLGYHLLNVLLHALNAILLWRILKRLGLPGAWAAAALFALHPVQVESVAWITELKNVLSTTFYLGAAGCYVRFAGLDGADRDRRGRQRLYAGALVLFLCALLTKTVTVTLPVALLLLIWWKRGALGRREILPTLPFFGLGLVLGLVTAWTEKYVVGAAGFQWSHGILERLLIAGRALWFYAVKLIWPDPIVFVYPRWKIDATDFRAYLFPVATIAVIYLLWHYRHKIGRGPLTAVLFFALTLSPALGFFDVYYTRYSFVADRWQYLACIGLLAGLAAGVRTGLTRSGARGAVVGFLTLCVLLLGLGRLTWKEAANYRDAETIWRATLAESPLAFAAHINLGSMLLQRGELAQAELHLRTAVQIQPDFPESRNNLGIVLHNRGHVAEAIAEYHEALRIYPDYADAHNNLGISLAAQGDLDGALTQFQTAVRLFPDFVNALRNLGTALLYLGRPGEATVHFERTVDIDPQDADNWILLGDAQAALGGTAEAIAAYGEALRLAPAGSRLADIARRKLGASQGR